MGNIHEYLITLFSFNLIQWGYTPRTVTPPHFQRISHSVFHLIENGNLMHFQLRTVYAVFLCMKGWLQRKVAEQNVDMTSNDILENLLSLNIYVCQLQADQEFEENMFIQGKYEPHRSKIVKLHTLKITEVRSIKAFISINHTLHIRSHSPTQNDEEKRKNLK